MKKQPFLLADIGEGIHEVELLEWKVKQGDKISQFDSVCTVQSDKATVDITSRFDGTVTELCGDVGDMIKVGFPLLQLDVEEREGEVSYNNSNAVENVGDTDHNDHIDPIIKIAPNSHKLNVNRGFKVLATPAVRRIARENSIKLDELTGSGKDGRILKMDLLEFLDEKVARQNNFFVKSNVGDSEEEAVVPIRGIRRAMFRNMEESLSIPHMIFADEINVDQLIKLREDLKHTAASENGIKLSFLPFMIKAVSLALNEFPLLNARISDDKTKIILKSNHNIAIAMNTSNGLIVPVIKGCQELSVLDIASELNRFQQLISNNEMLNEEDFSDPTFSISNIGAIGGTYMSPVVVPPAVAIGAIGKFQRQPRFVDETSDKVVVNNICQVSWAADHRIIEGAYLALFNKKWKEYVEKPSKMIFTMK